MQTHEKIRELWETHHWTQEEMASKIAMSTNGYAKIERGETRLTLQRLEQFAQIFNIDISELLNNQDANLFIQINKNNENNISIYGTPSALSQEIERLKLIISHQEAMMAKLNEQIGDLRALNDALQR